MHVGESEDCGLIDPQVPSRSRRDPEHVIVGIKVRVGRHASGDQGVAPLEYRISQVAEEAGLPLMAHIDEPPPSYRRGRSRGSGRAMC